MDRDPHPIDARVPQKEISGEKKTDDSVWTYLPIVVSAAVTCLLLFLFLSPNFETAEPVRAKSARPGAETGVTQERRASIERQKDRSPQP
jgi:hypothetical protein